MTDFRRLAMLSRAAVERIHGDAVIVLPVVRGTSVNEVAQPQVADGYETLACFFENTLAENEAMSRPLTGNGRLQHAAPAITASIRLVDGKALATGFVLRRLSDNKYFEISTFRPDGLGTVLTSLNARNAPAEEAP